MNKLSILLLFYFFSYSVQAQTDLSGVINDYAVVTDIAVDDCSVQLSIDDASVFSIGDKIVLMKMQGAQIDASNNADFGNVTAMNSTGFYEINEISTIDGNDLTLRYRLKYDDYMVNIGRLQIIRMPVYDNAEVVGTLTADAWNGNTGGVLALEVTGQLRMNADMDVSGLGFRGGIAKTAASNNCTWVFQQDDYYYDTENWRGSAKGEGIAAFINEKEHGRGAQANGGGGGNDHNSGGGGGANVSTGGAGGENDEPTTFGCKGRNPGIGGKAITDLEDRVFLGGGGGAGHENNEVATDGANGGGIVILIVNEFYPVGFSIRANGASALDGGGDGGGGGGAGGTILLDVQTIESVINLETTGGDGGLINNSNSDRCHGPGGGGSGGRMSTNLMVTDPFSATLVGGLAGQSINSTSCSDGPNGAQDGTGGSFETLTSLIIADETFPLPVADFNFDVLNGVVGFSNLSTDANTFVWDFGDMETDTGINPSHTYSENGTYTVQLIATNACGADTLSQEVIIMVDAAPVVAFTANTEMGCAPVTINYLDASIGNVDTYLWTFEGGEPASSTLANPQVSYTASGVYDVQLEVSGPGGTDFILMENFIEILPEASAGFNYVTNGATVDFTNTSSDALSYSWDFGDMETDTGINPSHEYDESGTYEVRLIATNTCGADTIYESIEIELLDALSAAFALDNGSGCVPWIVNFNDFSTGQVEDYLWTFEGGTPATSTASTPQVLYETPGTFDVRLEVSGPQGSDEILIEDQIVIAPAVVTSFGYNVVESEVSFINTSSNATMYQWDFGDGSPMSNEENPVHTYAESGTYTVTLLASSNLCGTVSTEVFFLDFVAIEELEWQSDIKIYPNPATDQVEIVLENDLTTRLQLFTVAGKEVSLFRSEFTNSLNLDLKNLVAGVYIILIEQNGQVYRERLFKL